MSARAPLGMAFARAAMRAALLVAPAVATAQPRRDTLRLTLPGAIATALGRSIALAAADVDRRAGGVAVLEAYSRFLPSLSAGALLATQGGSTLLSSTATVATDTRITGGAWTVSAGLNLFNGFRDQAALRAALDARDAAELTLARARQLVAYDVTQAFEQVVLDRQLITVVEAALGLSTAREEQLVEQVRVGTRAPPDLYRQRAQTAADRVRLIAARNRERADRVALLLRLRLPPSTALALEAPANADTADVGPADALARRALAARTDLAAAEARVRGADEQVRLAEGGWLPRVDLQLDAGAAGRYYDEARQGGTDVITTPQRPLATQLGAQRTVGLALGASWTPWDRGRTRADVQRARLAGERERLRAEELQLAILGEVDRAVADQDAARESLGAARAGLSAAEEAFTAVSGRYDVGLATFVELAVAQGALVEARAQEAAAQVNLRLQASVLRLVTGGAPAGP